MQNIKSMTGFASVRVNVSSGSLAMDLRSVNSRYLEATFKLPDNFKYLDTQLREILKSTVQRGKFEMSFAFIPAASENLHLNQALVQKLCNSLKEIKAHFPEGSADLTQVLLYPGVIAENNEQSREELSAEIVANFKELLKALIANREREGARLASVISEKIDALEKCLEPVKDQLDTLVAQERAKLQARLKVLKADVDENRLEQEVALLAQKADIAEEYDRLCSHISEVRRILKEGGSCGKRLDFMMQEFNREANTMASKASNLALTKIAVELKVLIEQMREQVQNIE